MHTSPTPATPRTMPLMATRSRPPGSTFTGDSDGAWTITYHYAGDLVESEGGTPTPRRPEEWEALRAALNPEDVRPVEWKLCVRDVWSAALRGARAIGRRQVGLVRTLPGTGG